MATKFGKVDISTNIINLAKLDVSNRFPISGVDFWPFPLALKRFLQLRLHYCAARD
jgi:hypothetical protein